MDEGCEDVDEFGGEVGEGGVIESGWGWVVANFFWSGLWDCEGRRAKGSICILVLVYGVEVSGRESE